jgi:hypothetical protein
VISQEDVMLRVIGGQPSLFGPDFHKLTSRKRYDPGLGSSLERDSETGKRETDDGP